MAKRPVEAPKGEDLDGHLEVTEGDDFLKVPFTDEEKAEHAQRLARTLPQIDQLEEELKSVKSQYKSRIEGLQAEAKKFSSYIRDGFHFDNVEIQIRKDFRAGTLEKIRLDTGEMYYTRTLTAEERQRSMFSEDRAPNGRDAHAD